MLEPTQINTSHAILEQYSIDGVQEKIATEEKNEKNQFLELMIAQLENQDPLEPQEGAQFLSQLAQFSTVEGIEKLNVSMADVASSFRSGQALQATALVGRKVEVQSDNGQLDNTGSLQGSVELAGASSNVRLSFLNSAGETVKEIDLGTQAKGRVPFNWNGIDEKGSPAAQGQYQVIATAQQQGEAVQLPVSVATNVNSVSIDSDGAVSVSLQGVGSIPLSSVKHIN